MDRGWSSWLDLWALKSAADWHDRCDFPLCLFVCFAHPAIEVEVRKLNDKIRAIRGMQDYQRVRMTRNGQRDDRAMGWTSSGLARLATRLLMCCDRSRRSATGREGSVAIEM